MDNLKADQALFTFPLNLFNLDGVLKDERAFGSFYVDLSQVCFYLHINSSFQLYVVSVVIKNELYICTRSHN